MHLTLKYRLLVYTQTESFLGELDGAKALSIGWHVSVVGQIYEQKLWSQDMLEQFAVEINNGALVNQHGAVKIYEMPLSAEEQALFDKSVKTVEDTFDSIKYLLED